MARLGQPAQISKVKSIEPAMAVINDDDSDYQFTGESEEPEIIDGDADQ